MRIFSRFLITLAVLILGTGLTFADSHKKLKAGFIYVGPVGDYGWSHAHDVGRKFAMEKLPWLETVYIESVGESDSSRIIDRLIQEQEMDVVFTTSFGYMDDTVKASKKYPNQTFMHASGFKQTKNLGTYFADLYQMYYLNGIMAGALTKTNKIGYVAAFPIPELIRHIDAFALGIKVANPKAKLDVRWIYAWYGPDKAKEAAEALIAEGVDALAFTEDTPAVIEVGQEHTEKGKQIYTFSHYSPMQPYGVDSVVSGQLVDWGIMYVKILQSIKDGTWNNKDMWWLAAEKGAILGGNFKEIINPKFIGDLKSYMIPSKAFGRISAYDLILKRYAQMKKGVHVFDPFTGPIRDNKGKLRIKKGAKASKGDLLSMMYYVDNVVGNIPK
ncbi:MAG: BMP family ABC transporter substrate-binding protein [Deltaproteobacteria bacterium]|jgi:basic membrane protein A and related proteins|nr:BMP family ABC transporter substrate-binding protein [Deltaproteobacteria bacterium]MBT4641152.1 BMP family ABC transporter substrate-binding protein [Deltaproteobacteria bacterium]MBT6504966.1 BMP family ABC transporter substrate-binding protein [Deltaproteobacteria bacterium]MBT6613000.1 BMP family ABC transporter substrate-binding protein [Deltaproteobacteria bacterium]MBT7153949.1 BMP family ABC transporter substrate-binding protein [Deltaproteobacteria bacterium]